MDEQHLAQELKTFNSIFSYEKMFLGSQIKKYRQRLKIKQSALAKLLSTSQSAIARIENGKQNLTLSLLIKISITLGKKFNGKFQ